MRDRCDLPSTYLVIAAIFGTNHIRPNFAGLPLLLLYRFLSSSFSFLLLDLSFCAQPSVLPKSCRFFTTVFSASPPTLEASFCAKTILRTHDVAKSVRDLSSWATSLRQYYDLCHTPADQFSRASKTARQRRDRCQT